MVFQGISGLTELRLGSCTRKCGCTVQGQHGMMQTAGLAQVEEDGFVLRCESVRQLMIGGKSFFSRQRWNLRDGQ